jgi:putative ABC transport system substrate-binding protein
MWLRTRGCLVLCAFSVFMVSLTAMTPPSKKVPTIGVLMSEPPPSGPDWMQRSVFLQELHTLGWQEGENIMVEYRWTAGRVERGTDLAAELVGLHVDVIVAPNASLVRAVQRATTTIPIVMLTVDDPVAWGFIASLARPSGNITGVDASLAPEFSGKMLEFLTEAVPAVTRIAVLVNPQYMLRQQVLAETMRVARALGMQPYVVEAQAPEDFARAFAAATKEGAGALLVLPSIVFGLHERRLAALAVEHRLPAIYWRLSFAKAGGLLAYGPKSAELWRRAAYYVDRILKGAKPADLPVERPMTFELIINLKTAQTLGITIPPTLLFQANEVIR